MDGKLKHCPELRLPKLNDRLIDFARKLDCTWIGAVEVSSKPHCREWDCHNNVIKYVDWYGGTKLLGYYLLEEVDTKDYVAILHSIVRRENNELVDITPFEDERSYNMCALLRDQHPNYSQQEIWLSDVTEASFSGIKL